MKATVLDPVSNDAEMIIASGQPYMASIEVVGTAPFLFHRWSVDGVEAKSKAAKGSKAKKEDDLESEDGYGLGGEGDDLADREDDLDWEDEVVVVS